MLMSNTQYTGLLFIGDPHLEGRIPGFRKDDFPTVILDKIAWCLHYAASHRLLPILLGDLFDKPRENPNWIIDKLLNILQGEILTIYGNHDVHYDPQLTSHDTLNLLVSAGRLRLLSPESVWQGEINGQQVVVGGSSYRQPIPRQYPLTNELAAAKPLVFWVTHHDLLIPGYDAGREKLREIPGIAYVINGHIHRHLADCQKGTTLWMTPGNISRRSRSDATREHVPQVLRANISAENTAEFSYVTVPHEPFEQVFHTEVVASTEQTRGSSFVAGLAELLARRTQTGAGFQFFLEHNLQSFEPDVSQEIRLLAQEVFQHE
jgi:DNA repair exonuclease SbcCD nuclease subunit